MGCAKRECMQESGVQATTGSYARMGPGKRVKNSQGRFRAKQPEDFRGLVSVGQRFGDWVVTSDEISLKGGGHRYVQCSDGYSEEWVAYDNLVSGKSKHSRKYPRTGIANYGKLRGRWEQMMGRCYNPAAKAYGRYGARGIRVAEEFHDPHAFARYLASLPRSAGQYQVDRIDNNRGYERGNLHWTTAAENNANKENNIHVTFNEYTLCLNTFVKRHCEISHGYARRLLEQGHTPECVAARKRMEGRGRRGGLRHCECGAEKPLHGARGGGADMRP